MGDGLLFFCILGIPCIVVGIVIPLLYYLYRSLFRWANGYPICPKAPKEKSPRDEEIGKAELPVKEPDVHFVKP